MAHAAIDGDGIKGQRRHQYGITDRGSASVGLRVFALPYTDANTDHSRRRLSPYPMTAQATRPYDLVSRSAFAPSYDPGTGHRHLGEFVIGIVQVRFNLCCLAF